MNLLIAATKAILNNPVCTPERKERAIAELRGIPPNDPRHADAQRVLAETVKAEPSPGGLDFERLQKLYAAANSEDTSERADARKVVAEIQDRVLSEYLSRPENYWGYDGKLGTSFQYIKKGKRIFDDEHGLYARLCLEHTIRNEDMPAEDDKLGIILAHHAMLLKAERQQ